MNEIADGDDVEPGFEPDVELEAPKKRRGRTPRGGRVRTVVTKQTFVGDEDETEDESKAPLTFATLFDPGPEDANNEVVIRVRVQRSDPYEGMLGYITDMNATEDAIKDEWGGSGYRLEGLNARGRIVRVKTLKIAGDPKFVSEAAEIAWRKSKGLPPRSQQQQPQGPSIQELLSTMDAREDKRRAEERERDEQRRRDEREAEERRRREEREFRMEQEKLRQDAEDRRKREEREWEERKKRDQDERDRQRRAEEAEREERRRADMAERDQRQQMFMQQMLSTVRESAAQSLAFAKELSAAKPQESIAETVKTIAMIKDVFGNGGSGEEEASPLSILAKVAPQLMEGIGGAIREVRGGVPPQQVMAPPIGVIPQLPPVLAEKVQTLVAKVAAKGKDPEKFMEAAVDTLTAAVDGAPVSAPQPVASAAPELPINPPQAAPAPAPPAGDRAVRLKFS